MFFRRKPFVGFLRVLSVPQTCPQNCSCARGAERLWPWGVLPKGADLTISVSWLCAGFSPIITLKGEKPVAGWGVQLKARLRVGKREGQVLKNGGTGFKLV